MFFLTLLITDDNIFVLLKPQFKNSIVHFFSSVCRPHKQME